jgi:taspase (threonine aspartase 1)
MLTSEGARSFAVTQSNQIQTVPSESLVSPRAREEWKKWKDRLEGSVQHETMPESMKDTVGAVVYHHADGMAAGVSRSSEN